MVQHTHSQSISSMAFTMSGITASSNGEEQGAHLIEKLTAHSRRSLPEKAVILTAGGQTEVETIPCKSLATTD